MTNPNMKSQASEGDLQLMVAAGRAIGLDTRIEHFRELRAVAYSAVVMGDFDAPDLRIRGRYNPLEDDAQCMRLAATLGIGTMHMFDNGVFVADVDKTLGEHSVVLPYSGTSSREVAATMRRGIVMVAALVTPEGGKRA